MELGGARGSSGEIRELRGAWGAQGSSGEISELRRDHLLAPLLGVGEIARAGWLDFVSAHDGGGAALDRVDDVFLQRLAYLQPEAITSNQKPTSSQTRSCSA